MKFRSVYSILLIIICFFPLHPIFAVVNFPRSLKVGDSGDDVRKLQVILNSSVDTGVAASGLGSPGQETNYFGLLTKEAVMRFQKKYSPEVLFPAGVALPTGVVGEFTRKKLELLGGIDLSGTQSLLPASVNVPKLPTTSSQAVPFSAIDTFYSFAKPKLGYLSTYQAVPRSTITVYGVAFQKTGNTVCFGDVCVENLESSNGTSLEVSIPDTVKVGSYNVYVKTKNGSTFNSEYGNYFTVTNSPAALPIITKIFPDVISPTSSEKITIEGAFDSINNQVITPFGTIKNKTAVNGQIHFSLQEINIPDSIKNLKKGSDPVKIPIPVYVKTSAGVTMKPITLHFSI